MARRRKYVCGAHYREVMARKASMGSTAVAEARARNRAELEKWQAGMAQAVAARAAPGDTESTPIADGPTA